MTYSTNDWSQLEEVIVGTASNSLIPRAENSVRNFMYAKLELSEIDKFTGPYDVKIIDETNEDLENLCLKFSELNVKVYRPSEFPHFKEIKTPEWSNTGWSNYCPRDVLLVLGDTIIEVPSPMRSRIFEVHSYHDILYQKFLKGAKWISAPRPRITDDCFQFTDLSISTLKNTEILFDAPNILRLNNDLLYQISNSGNFLGYQWLCSTFPNYKVHLEEKSYSGAHLDSTILPLREGLVLFNSNRVTANNYPKIFEKWDKIFFNDIVDVKSDVKGISSSAIGLNLLSINENLVILDENQLPLIKTLAKYKIESIPMKLRHSRILGGGFHCVTLDIKRKK